MIARGATLAVLVAAGVASAEPAPKPADIKPYRERMIVLKDAEGGVYAVVNDSEPHVFYGAGKVLYEQILGGGRSRNGDGWSISVFAPRLGYPFTGYIERRKNGTFRRGCGHDHTLELTELTGDQAKAVLDKSKFMTTSMTRKPYLIARDDRGVYYYVDVVRELYGGNGHRVFVGKKGAMKQLPLTDVTIDSGGEVFSTKTGDLRFVRTIDQEDREKITAVWIRGARKQELILLDLYMSQPLIYKELGLYKIPGTICGSL